MLPWLFTGYGGYGFGSYVNPAADARIAAEQTVMPVDARVHHLELACAGLWELLKTKLGATDEELIAAIQKVDEADGTRDGRVGHSANAVCPQCGRKLLTHGSPRCSWCGADLHMDPFKRI
jgi:hypothetical protein